MDAIFCIYIWDLKPDFKPVKLKRTNEENEKGLWWCHSYNERGRPWGRWKVRKLEPEYQKDIFDVMPTRDECRFSEWGCSSLRLARWAQQGPALPLAAPWLCSGWGRGMDRWGSGGSAEGRCTQMAGRSSGAAFSFVLQFAGTVWEIKMVL